MLLRRQHDSVAVTSDMLAWLFEGLVRTGQKSKGLPAGQHLSGTAIEVRQSLQCFARWLQPVIYAGCKDSNFLMQSQVIDFSQPDTEEDKQLKREIQQNFLDLGKQLQRETMARK